MLLRLIQSIVLLLYGLMIGLYWRTGKLAFLVNPVYNSLILAGGLFLFLVGFYLLLTAKRFPEHHLDFSWGQRAQWALLFLPLFFGIFFIPQPLSGESALLRGVTQDLSTGQGTSPFAFAKPPQERSLIEWVRILNYDPEPAHHTGQPVSLNATMLPSSDLPEDYFYLSRFLLTCCAADARGVVIAVHYDPHTFTPVADQWVHLEGEITEGELNGRRQAVIEYKSHQNIDVPKDPYAE